MNISLAALGKELQRASEYESAYYELLERYDELDAKYGELLQNSYDHSQNLLGSVLTLGLKLAADKDKEGV